MNNLSPGAQGVMQGMGFSRPDMSHWNNMLNNWRQQMQANNYSYNAAPSQQMTRLQKKARYQRDR